MSKRPLDRFARSHSLVVSCETLQGLLDRYKRCVTHLWNTCSYWCFLGIRRRCTSPFYIREKIETVFLRRGSTEVPLVSKINSQPLFLVDMECPRSIWVEGKCLIFSSWDGICMNPSCMDEEDHKAPCLDMVYPRVSCSCGKAANVSYIHVHFLTTASEWGGGTRMSCVGVVSPGASWAYVGGLRASWAGKEFSRAPRVYIEVPGTLFFRWRW